MRQWNKPLDEDKPDPAWQATGTEPARYRAIFISDLHLGTPGCQAEALLDFLKHHPSQML